MLNANTNSNTNKQRSPKLFGLGTLNRVVFHCTVELMDRIDTYN